jgi:hypothetical protein
MMVKEAAVAYPGILVEGLKETTGWWVPGRVQHREPEKHCWLSQLAWFLDLLQAQVNATIPVVVTGKGRG